MDKNLTLVFITVILPVVYTIVTSIAAMYRDKQRTQIIIKAIEANNDIDTDQLAASLQKPRKSEREVLNLRLLRGCIFALCGALMMAVGLANFAMGADFSADPVTLPMLFGGISAAVGASYLIVYFATRRQTEGNDASR